MAETPKNYCYILVNAARTHSYAGYTVNPARRLRQHNGEICGGAMYTKRTTPGQWEFAMVIECGDWTKRQALSFEWHLKTHGGKRQRGTGCGNAGHPIKRRIDLFKKALANPKFEGMEFTVNVADFMLAYV